MGARSPTGGGALTPRATPRGTREDARAGPLQCQDCPMWYGAENGGLGPCSIKNRRGDTRYLTWGGHACDEAYVPPPVAPTFASAAELSGARSTSSASAVGYTSTSKAGHGKSGATSRKASGASSTRRRATSKR